MTGLWILLAGAVATAVCIFLLGQLALWGARRVARSKAYQNSLRRVKTAHTRTLTSLQKMSTMQLKQRSMGAMQAGGSDGGCAPYDSGASEAAANGELPRFRAPGGEEQQAMLAAAVDDLAARLEAVQQLVRLNGGGSGGGGDHGGGANARV